MNNIKMALPSDAFLVYMEQVQLSQKRKDAAETHKHMMSLRT